MPKTLEWTLGSPGNSSNSLLWWARHKSSEKAMATHSSALAWKIPWMEEPGGGWCHSAYLRLLIFLPAILIPACALSSPAFHVMYSAYKLNKQGDNIQPWHTPFPIWNQSIVPCPVLTVASWPAYRFLGRQVRWSGMPISLRVFYSLLIHTVKGFGIDKGFRSLENRN